MPRARRRSFPIPTQESLSNAALHYLSRYAASEESLRKTLLAKIRRAAAAHPEFSADRERQAALRLQIEGIVARHKLSGALDDEAFAETKVASLRRAGKSRRAIQQKLAQKGVSPTLIARALETHARDLGSGEDAEEDAAAQAEERAAIAFARKRRLGPFRVSSAVAEKESGEEGIAGRRALRTQNRAAREASSLLRAGFAPALVGKVLALSPDVLEEVEALE